MTLQNALARRRPYIGVSVIVGLVSFVAATVGTASAAPGPVNLGTADGFAVLAATTITNTGPSVITGDIGVSPGSAITGFPPGVVVGTVHPGDPAAAQAEADAATASTDLASRPCDTDLTGQDLGGLTLTPATYCFAGSAQLSGILTLDAQGDPNAVFIFKVGSTLTTATNSSINLVNGADATNVFFRVGSSATIGTGTQFEGTILATISITTNTSASVDGRLIALTGAVTLDSNRVTRPRLIPPCTSTLTGDFLGPVTVNSGERLCIVNARVVGPVTVNPGGGLSVLNSQISRGIVADGPVVLSICGSQVSPPVSGVALRVTGATVPIRIGDPASACAGNRFAGDVNLTGNQAVTFGSNIGSTNVNINNNGPGNTVIKADTVLRALNCAGNNPAPSNAGMVNTAGSKTGQCVTL
ncbi:MAG: ice-binding family protein [Actinomycetota bacterium]|nr:ice-binding family protein [Actinomycetota bacterium]